MSPLIYCGRYALLVLVQMLLFVYYGAYLEDLLLLVNVSGSKIWSLEKMHLVDIVIVFSIDELFVRNVFINLV